MERALFVSEGPEGWDGCAALAVEEGQGWLLSMWVAPESRGRGIGEELIKSVVARASSLGLPTVNLHVNVANAHAIALYERCGFSPTGHTMALERDPSITEQEMTLLL